MPATFESFGIKFLYPDNWVATERSEDEDETGVTLDLPSGGFFTIELEGEGFSESEVIERVRAAIVEEFGEVEVEEVVLDRAVQGERTVEMRFYYLDLLIVSRLVLLPFNGETLIVQMQAENRDFDRDEPVFDAILKQLRL
ncbi:MAG: hypothetical protein WBD20_12880 [Pirellulaceae bacterium]